MAAIVASPVAAHTQRGISIDEGGVAQRVEIKAQTLRIFDLRLR